MFTRDTFHGWFFHGLGLHSAARCGTRPGDFDDDEFSAIAREMTRQRLGVRCRACGGQRLGDSLPHTHRRCVQLPMFIRYPCNGDNVEAEVRRLSSPWWHWCCPHDDWPCGRGARGWSELGPELISFSLRRQRCSSCISSMATELSSWEL